ncbi:hypothetical protein CcaverHIS002_0206450 [Cutaneotrichosporon cavernicola]|uniref:Uncharacterized protein n=1 Tax=Cutaneotrichosporon cavernicola TaxID=279322 RepID=A0AA48I8Z8_9TREE|nr:uncharacterized protein CcaverHIS019_0206420 [Cutaneotrichosporon cavernicola]BEI81485.1 hypothetical protein CcaverHIS002_0206450 [Cutaneotrichosporon cavernicola]BEI89280.1 hypothetical protein CcaverHIS019_0206420 [Cutaneotrichosporon cavernicola]BEI97056.1 hypothetical protein CcaverHIS631_0206450 [Cutaneotrichosporon cavernicola]BEJ04829.1 hypothetical protein CcaverHIS641_0206460 [Cutaneotrichosporon cavernicola]
MKLNILALAPLAIAAPVQERAEASLAQGRATLKPIPGMTARDNTHEKRLNYVGENVSCIWNLQDPGKKCWEAGFRYYSQFPDLPLICCWERMW